MEMLIRTPDMPGVHQKRSDVSEVYPSDDEIPRVLKPSFDEVTRDYVSETKTVLYMDPEEHVKKLHMSYNDIIDAVNRCVESGAGIIWDTYQQFIKVKSANPEKYKEAICEMKNINSESLFSVFDTRINNLTKNKKLKEGFIKDYYEGADATCAVTDEEDLDCFRTFFINILHDNHNCDLPALLNNNDYLDEIAKLRFGLQNIRSNFKFDVENCVEYTAHRPDCFYYTAELSSIAFKVKPYIKGISLTPGNSIDNAVPTVDFKICIDMHKMITWLMNNCKLPDELPELIESGEIVRDEYVRSVLGEYPSFAEKVARRIVMELFDTFYNVQGNWRRFIQKFIMSYNKLLTNPDVENLVGKVNYFCNLSETHNDPKMIQESTFGNNELFGKMFELINDSYSYDDQFINQLFDSLSFNSESNKGDFIINQAAVLFRKTFTVFFEDAVLFTIRRNYSSNDNGNNNQHYNKALSIQVYTREFYKGYNIGDLLEKASSISDYNIRDFIQTIITESKSCKNTIYDPGKMANGEYLFFMYSKLSRKIWMDLTNGLILASKLVGMMEQTKPRTEQDAKLHESIKRRVNSFAEFTYGTLLNMLTEARFIPRTNIGYMFSWKDEFLSLKKYINFCNEFVKPVVSSDNHKIDELVRDVLRISDSKEENAHVDSGFIVSYDVSDRDKYDLKHNFTMALQRRGLVGLDF